MAEPLPTTEPRDAEGRNASDSSCRLTPSPDAAVVFASLASQAIGRFCDVVVVDISDDDNGVHLTIPDDVEVSTARRLRAELRVPVAARTGHAPGAVQGLVTYGWTDGRPTEAVEMLARVLVDQALDVLAWQRSEQRAHEAATKAANLEIALTSSRQIGAAVGIVMSQRKATSEVAFELLRQASQRQHRKLYDIALDVLDTGWLDPGLVRPRAAPQVSRADGQAERNQEDA